MLGNAWTKSSRCGADQPSCVEAAYAPARITGASRSKVLVRDSKDPDGALLQFTEEAWRAFIGGAKDGEFDLA